MKKVTIGRFSGTVRFLTALVVTLGFAAAVLLGGSFLSGALRGQSAEEVEVELATALPAGTSVAKVTDYLDEHGIEREPVRLVGDYGLQLGHADLPRSAPVIYASIPNTSFRDLFVTRNIGIYFLLDENQNRLERIYVQDEATGP